MTTPTTPDVDCERVHACLRARDILAAVDYYTNQLGFSLGFTWGDPVTFAGVNLGDVQLFLDEGTPNPDGCSVFFVISDADELCDFHRSRGVDVVVQPEDRPYGIRDYTVRDLNGYFLTFGHYIYNTGPPITIERVDVPLRLEKRLAGLLEDLAEHKRMSLTECLEEILLHTCEPYGDGVASPHTGRTLRFIQELKRNHGIDYDSHASYRFVEEPTGGSD